MAAKATAPVLRWNVGSEVNSVAVSHGGSHVASGSDDRSVCIWDVQTGALVIDPFMGHASWVWSVAWSHDDTLLVSSSEDYNIRIWNTRTGAPIGDPIRGHTSSVCSVAFSHDSTRIVSGSWDDTIRIWDVRTGAPVGEPLRGHTRWVFSVAPSPDNTRIVSGSGDCTIRIWDARNSAPIGEPLTGHTGYVQSVAFSPDSNLIVSGSWDKTIRIWDAHTGAPIGEPLRRHTSWVMSVAFSHDSTRIVSGSADCTIRIWDARTGAPIGEPLTGHTSSVRSVAFSADNTRIVSSSDDRTICVWETPQSILSFDMVTSDMSVEEMFGCLVRHGCSDLSTPLAQGRYSSAPIANGGFGEVWQVTLGNGAVLAVKTLRLQTLLKGNDKGAKRAAREVHHWSILDHPNVHQLLGIVVFRGGLGMVSPWLNNGSLPNYLDQHPEVERYPLCAQLASGVSYLHSVAMVHGDLKANNVLVSNNGTLKINDFDHAVLSDSALHFSTTTRPGGGTLRWMAPELYEAEDEEGGGELRVKRSKETDIYALGMTMLEIFTGTVPFAEYRTEAGVCAAILKKKMPRQPSELSGLDEPTRRMWELLVQCWYYHPAARPDASTVLRCVKRYSE